MNLRNKLLLNSLLPLVLSILMIGFIVWQMTQIQSSSKSEVENLVEVQKLDASILSVQQALGTYALAPSEANAYVVKNGLELSGKAFNSLDKNLSNKEHIEQLKKASVKFSALDEAAAKALREKNDMEAKRLSLRTKGILNDIFYLKKITNESYAHNQQMLKRQIGFVITAAIAGSLILLLVTSFMTFLFTGRISTPIRRLSSNAAKIADRDLTIKIEALSSKDEVGQLNESFRKMADNLNGIIAHVAQSNEKVSTSAQKLHLNSENAITSTHTMAAGMKEMAAGSEKQLRTSMECAQSVEETTIGITRIADSASQLAELTSDTVSKAEDGRQFVKRTVQQMNTIQQSVDMTDERVRDLSSRSKEIDDIVRIISSIAEQTNLLALNAAIEAARAGESGKGFAVVADEVRKLAEETNVSAKKIGTIVHEVQTETALSVKSMNEVRQNVEEGIQITVETESKFSDILTAMERMTAQIEEISASSEEISAGSEEVAASVQEMAEVARVSNSHTSEAAASAEEQLASMGDIKIAVEHLSEMAEDLRTVIATFKRNTDS